MTSLHELPALLTSPTVQADDGDPFIDTLIETARRNIARPGAAIAVVPVQLTAAVGWCAPHDPDYEPPTPAPPKVPRLVCGCPEAMLEIGQHERGCTVLDILATVEEVA